MERRPGVAHLQRWTPAEVRGWLQSINLGRFAPLFEEHDVGGDVLLDVTQEDLQEMGVTKVGDKKRLMRALEALQAEAAAREGPCLDIAVLGASPLVHVNRSGGRSEVIPLDSIDLAREHDRLRMVVRDLTDEHTRVFETGTFDALSRVLQLRTIVLTLTAYVTPDGRLLLETPTGEAAEFDPSRVLPDMLGTGSERNLPVCIVLSLCGRGLLNVAQAFLRYGARHVVAVMRKPQRGRDVVARVFSEVFHKELLGGTTVADAFSLALDAAKRHDDGASRRRHPSDPADKRTTFQSPERKFVLLPDGDDVPGRHAVNLFPPSFIRAGSADPCEGFDDDDDNPEIMEGGSGSGGGPDTESFPVTAANAPRSFTPCSAVRPLTKHEREPSTGADSAAGSGSGGSAASSAAVSRSPRREVWIVGRQRDIWQVVLALSKSRCVIVCGVGGAGKAELCRSIASHLEQRGRRHCERGVHTVRLRGIRTVHAAAAQLRHALDEAAAVGSGSAAGTALGNRGSSSSTPGNTAAASSHTVAVEEDFEAVAARLGERLLVLTNVEELLHSEAVGFAKFIDALLACGPRLRILLTSRRAIPPESWPARSNQLPFHVYLRQLEPHDSAELLLDLVPELDWETVVKIAGLCGHLPLALKLVGQRLAAAKDPAAEAREIIAETTQSPEKRASMFFSHSIAPYVWRSLDATRRAALAALSIFRGSFGSEAAAAVLGLDLERTLGLLREFQDQCLVERPVEAHYYMPTSVHLLVHQQLTDPASADGVMSADLIAASERLVLHFVALLRDVARATASDRGRGGAGLAALRTFDRQRADIDLALVLAGTSDLFVLMVQLGRDIFDTRLSPQQRVDIYERLLGIIMGARKAPASLAKAKPPAPAPRFAQLLRAFERSAPVVETRTAAHGSRALERTTSTPAGTVSAIGGNLLPRTQPNTPVARGKVALSDSDNEGGLSPPFSKSLPASPHASVMNHAGTVQSQPGLSFMLPPAKNKELAEDCSDAAGESDIEASRAEAVRVGRRSSLRRYTHTGQMAEPLPCPAPMAAGTPKASEHAGGRTPTSMSRTAALLPAAAVRPRAAPTKRWPSYIFATSESGGDASTSMADEQQCDGSSADWRGVAASRPPWCPVLTAAQNSRLRPHLERVVQTVPMQSPTPSGGESGRADHNVISWQLTPGSRTSSSQSVGISSAASTPMANSGASPVSSRWGPAVWWHADPTLDSILIEVLLRLGAAHSALGRYAHAAQLLRKALIRTEEMVQRSGAEIGLSAEAMRAELLGTLSGVLCQQSLTQEAEAMLWQARQLAKHAGHTELYVKLTCDLAEFNWTYKGNLKAAQKLFREGLEMRMKTLGLEHLDTASTLNAVGTFSAQKGDLEEARKLISDSIQIHIRLLGSRWHLSVAEAYHNLAAVLDALQNHTEASRFYEAALEVKKRVLPESHVSISDTENHLSALYSKMKKHEECVQLLRGCLQQHLRTVGEIHASTASVQVNLGHALHMLASARRSQSPALAPFMALLEESEAFLESALKARKQLFHKRHPSIAECRANLGYVHFKKQEFDKSEGHFSAALKICRRLYGRIHPDIALWTFWLGKTQFEQRRICRGRETLRLALQIADALAQSNGRGQNPFNHEHREEIRLLLDGTSVPNSPVSASTAAAAAAAAATAAAAVIAAAGTGHGLVPSDGEPETVTEPAEEPPSLPEAKPKLTTPTNMKSRPRPMALASPTPSPSPSPSESETTNVNVVQARCRGAGTNTPLGRGSAGVGTPQSAAGMSIHRSSEHSSPESSSGSGTDEEEETSGGRSHDVDGRPSRSVSYLRILRRVRRSAEEYEISQHWEPS